MKVLIGKKVGMTQIFKENGKALPVTVLDVSKNVVSKLLKKGDAVTHIEIGKDQVKKPNKADQGNYKVVGYVPSFKTTYKAKGEVTLEEGAEVKADIFAQDEVVNVTSTSKGKGFRSVIQRYGFAGGPRTHGASDRERAPGSLGTRTIPGRVFKGKRMGGHVGNLTKTVTNLKVAYIDAEQNLIAVEGSVPGVKGAYVIIKSKKFSK